MFYPTPAIDELMPDALVHGIDKKMVSNYKNRMGYFTRKNLEPTMPRKKNKSLRSMPVEKTFEATKGVCPSDMVKHPQVAYSYKGELLLLNGLDNATNIGIVNNGTWRP